MIWSKSDVNSIEKKCLNMVTDVTSLVLLFDRYKHTIYPQLNRNSLDLIKLKEFSVLLVQALIDAAQLYPAIDQVIKENNDKYSLTETEATYLIDLALISQLEMMVINDKINIDLLKLCKKIVVCDVDFLNAVVRNACGYSVTSAYPHVIKWLKSNDVEIHNMFGFNDCNKYVLLRFDQHQSHLSMIHNPEAHQNFVEDQIKKAEVEFAIGLYGEDRACYQSSLFNSPGCSESRSMHLGIDIFTQAQTPVFVPIDGRVISIKYNAEELDYGYTVIIEHSIPNTDINFYTLYGHLAQRTQELISMGDEVQGGQKIAYLGQYHENGGWSPHLHFQIMTDMLSCQGDFYGACEPSMWPLWQKICPNPQLLMKIKVTDDYEDHQSV